MLLLHPPRMELKLISVSRRGSWSVRARVTNSEPVYMLSFLYGVKPSSSVCSVCVSKENMLRTLLLLIRCVRIGAHFGQA